MRTNPNWERLNVVGKVGTNYLSHDNTYIDLRGGLLAIHEVAPGRFGSTYVPINSTRKTHKKRRDGSLLIRAVGAPLLGLIVFVLFMALLGEVVSDEVFRDSLLMAFAIVALVLIGVYSLANFIRFLIGKPTTSITFNADDGEHEINFWHSPGRAAGLDRIVESAGNCLHQEEEGGAVTIAHNWSYIYPAKNAALLTASLYLLCLFLAGPLGVLIEIFELNRLGHLWIALPPSVGLLFYFRARYILARNQGASRDAIEQFVGGDYVQAQSVLRDILEADSDDQEALSLLSHLYVETEDYEKALKILDFFELEDDEIRFKMAQYLDLIRTWREEEPVLQRQLDASNLPL